VFVYVFLSYKTDNHVTVSELKHNFESRTSQLQIKPISFFAALYFADQVAGSIPVGVSGFFIDVKSFLSHYGPGVDSASNKNEYQEYFLGVKAAGAQD